MLHCFDMAGPGGTHSSGNRTRQEQTTGAGIGPEPGPGIGPGIGLGPGPGIGPGPESGAENRVGKNRIWDNLLFCMYS